MEDYKNFHEYLKSQPNLTTLLIKEHLLNLEFEIIGNSNSHNYSKFADEKGRFIFNNLENAEYSGRSIHRGCVSGTEIGNSLNFSDIRAIVDLNRIRILKRIEICDSEMLLLNQKKNEALDQLEFLTLSNKETVTKEEFSKYVLDNITKVKV